VEVPAAEAIRLVAGGLHLHGVGTRGECARVGKLCGATRMNNNSVVEGFYSRGERARMARIYASPCSEATPHCAAAQSCRRCSHSAQEARRVETTKHRGCR
jgi:hypothetical protein